MRHSKTVCLLLFLALSACTRYEEVALKPSAQHEPDELMHITIDAALMPAKSLRAHHFDAADGLDITEAAMVAVINNPDLKLARDDVHIAQAQALASGLLPDPQISLSHDLSNTDSSGSNKAYSFGLSYDITSLLQYSSAQKTEKAELQKIDLTILWQELQVTAQAQLLFIKLQYLKNLNPVLQETEALLTSRLANSKIALQKGLQTSDIVINDLTALQDVQQQIFALKKDENQTHYDFNTLLGLSVDAVIPLQNNDTTDDTFNNPIDNETIQQSINDLPYRRPDLLALEAGYQAQDQRYYSAIIAQFPAINIGLTHARDSGGIYSNSLGIDFSLPLFNRSRANIKIEKATRQRLYDEYQQRITSSCNEIYLMQKEEAFNQQQLLNLNTAITELSKASNNSEVAYQAGNIDTITYTNTRLLLMNKKIESLYLQHTLLEQHLALQTLLATDLPTQHLTREQ